ncbi:hypothetical protein [Acrocarpospora catenulata]|uniref:hypothetical protein n=1 Tax=Acrocarpospora catenulata TaxID=2836182 RepID=UPI001BD9FADD|nr:hypothetical protein [Acrocarpospora catenulata]
MTRSAQYLTDADGLLRTGEQGLWPRATAFLIRLALESCLDDYWRRVQPGVERCDTRTQILCLTHYRGQETSRLAARAWAGLSRACHYHGYELSPTASELRALHNEVGALLSRLSS